MKKKMKTKVACCSVCQTRYDEEERVPLLLQCGHGFCRDCLSRMFSASTDTTLTCPPCRHVSLVGNSVYALPKNYPVLALLRSPSSNAVRSVLDFDFDYTDEEDEEEEEDGGVLRRSSAAAVVAAHGEVRLVRRIGEGRREGVETWTAVIGGGGRQSGRKVAVKKVDAVEEVEWVMEKLEVLRRGSMWCRNVCTFHGAMRVGDSLCIVMDRCYGSVQSEMQRNEGRLTLEQVLRYGADITRGIAELHAAGVVCMNIKPSNLLLDSNGHAVVSDYGLAAILKKHSCWKAQPECYASKTHSCMECTMLSPHYTAPEAWGEPVKKSLNLFWDDAIGISTESDSWSFGCTLVEMCTGFVPWAGLSTEEIYQAVVKAKKLPPQYASVVGGGIPSDLWRMIGECLQFKPSKRPSFNAMLTIFLRHLQGIPRSPPASPDNDFVKSFSSNGMELSPLPELEVSQQNPFHLHQLVSAGDVRSVRDLLVKAASDYGSNYLSSLLETQNAEGQTALHLACRRGSTELVEAILEYEEANVDVLDKDGDPPLVYALAAGSPECVHGLIKRSANVRSRLKDGFGPSVAHVCAYHGQPDCMQELLLAGADPNAVDDEGESVLHIAVAKKYTECALVILESGGSRSMAILNSKNMTPLHLCVATWNVAVVKRWVGVATSDELAESIDIPSSVGTALCMAAASKKDHESEGRELVQILLAAGADPYAQDSQRGWTALHIAVMTDDVELVKVILAAGVDVNIRNAHNSIPLHIALARGAKSCVQLLLSVGANCSLQDDDGNTSFHIAADTAKRIRENLDWLIVMLRNPNADVVVRNHSGKTLRDILEVLPREWISEDLLDALMNKGVCLSPTIFDVGDWVKFRKTFIAPTNGWAGDRQKLVGFVQKVSDKDNLIVSFCSGEYCVLANEVVKVIPLDRGQHVQLKEDVKEPRFGWPGQSRDSIGTVLCVDDDGIIRVGFPGQSRGWKADPGELERVEEFKVGDWVRIRPSLTSTKYGLGSVTPGSTGIVYCIRPDSSLLIELSYLSTPWHCEPEEVEHVVPFRIDDQVCVKRSVAEPRYAWGGETHHSVGKIREIESDGLLIIDIPNRPVPWQADPSDMEKLEDFKVGDWVRVKASVSAPRYGWEDITRNSIGVIHSLEDDGDMGIAFCFRNKLFPCSVTDVEKVPHFEVGQEIRMIPSLNQPRLGRSNESPATVGKIVRIDLDGALNVRVPGRRSLWKVSPGDVEQLPGFEVGDWVRSKPSLGSRSSYDLSSFGRESIAVVHSVQDSGYLELACCFRKLKSWTHYTEVEKVPGFKVGQYVRFRTGLVEPRWGWRGAQPESRGVLISIHADGEVKVAFFGLPELWRGDPADLEIEQTFEVGEWVRLKDNANDWKSIGPGSVGVVQGIGHEGDEGNRSAYVAFCGEQERWVGPSSHLERVHKLFVGQKVRVKLNVKQPRFGWSGHTHESIGMIQTIDADGKLRIYTPVGSKAWMLDPSEVEAVEQKELCIGDWVKVKASVSTPTHQWGEVTHSSIGVVHRMENEDLWVTFCFMERLWLCKAGEMEQVRPFKVGDNVRIKDGLVTPRWGWGMETHASKGRVVGVDANGKLRIKFQWREGRPWVGDPSDIVLDQD
ncbi:E3 ubiquitin-protein ligase KEG-like [Abrus precatorius]|uniref:RING-type E3 ubiquitin transferase n=1 Tax=Abrus precatorius TaxID=3816 RepID=A0A8B8LEB7_ABRPR|nr:E3 ubiquitin-protein ligase KEG-like [Abrus precatorius]